jgi:hypothetical protein
MFSSVASDVSDAGDVGDVGDVDDVGDVGDVEGGTFLAHENGEDMFATRSDDDIDAFLRNEGILSTPSVRSVADESIWKEISGHELLLGSEAPYAPRPTGVHAVAHTRAMGTKMWYSNFHTCMRFHAQCAIVFCRIFVNCQQTSCSEQPGNGRPPSSPDGVAQQDVPALPECVAVNKWLLDEGYSPFLLSSADVLLDAQSNLPCVPADVVERWARSLIVIVEEIAGKARERAHALSQVSLGALDTGKLAKDAHEAKVRHLQELATRTDRALAATEEGLQVRMCEQS